MRRHQEDTSSLRSRGNWSSMRWDIPQGAWDLRLVFSFTSQHLVWPEDQARPADHGAHRGWSLHYQHPAPGHQLRATPTCSLSGCDKPTGGPRRWTSLCRMGCPAAGRQEASAYGRLAEGGKRADVPSLMN